MKKSKFLKKLKKEEKLELVEPSENICNAYSKKSSNCMKLLINNLNNEYIDEIREKFQIF